MPKFVPVNHDFFKIWSPEMAYILGYIAADGCLIKNKRGAHFLSVDSVDKGLILQMRRLMNSKHYISKRLRSDGFRYRIQIGSKEIFNDLCNLGVTPQKEFRLAMPKVPEKFFPYFLRGFFDGDGNVFFGIYRRTNRKRGFCKYFRVSWATGSRRVLEDIQKRLLKMGFTKAKICFSGKAWRLYIYGAQAAKLFPVIYQEPLSFLLKRKHKYFKTAITKLNGPLVQSG